MPSAVIKGAHMSPHTISLPQSIHQLQSFLSALTLLNKIIYIKAVFVHTSPNTAAGSAMHMRHWLILIYSLLDNLAQNPHWTLFQTDFCTETYLGILKLIIGAFHVIERSINVLFSLKWVVSGAATVTPISLTLISPSVATDWFISTALLCFDIYLI